MGLHKAISLCMDHCYNSKVVGDDNWYKTVVLAGGSSCFPGLPGIFLSILMPNCGLL
jgi:actin-related protein 8, plant